jgi:DNA (cytosine-5)-methyltransferase 1
MEFRLGELFCGPGGIGYAAMTAQCGEPSYKISHAWANDYDHDTCQIYIKNVSHDSKSDICQDIRELKYDKLKKNIRDRRAGFWFSM